MRGWGGRIRTSAWRNQNPLPYHLATPQRRAGGWLARAIPLEPGVRGGNSPPAGFNDHTDIAPAVAAAARSAAMFFA